MASTNGVEIRYNLPNKGKGLFATRDFERDEVLVEEKPLVCAQYLWNTLYKYAACDHCIRTLETAQESCRRLANKPTIELPEPDCCETKKDEHVMCPQCQIKYCSAECRQAAWSQYHQVLCMGESAGDENHPLNRLAEAWRQIHYPPESCSIMLIARIIATVKQAEDKDAAIQTFSQFCNMTVNDVEAISHKLLGDKFQAQIELFRSMFTETLYDENVQHWFTPEGFRSVFALIGRNGQGIASSSISRWVHNIEKMDGTALDSFIDKMYEEIETVSGPFLDCEGSGLYSLQSACNHSCAPNADITFPYNNSTLAMKVLRPIATGEEVFISYLDECELSRSRHSRQKTLRENYLFNCACVKCVSQNDDPDVTSEEEESMEDDEEEGEEDGETEDN